MRTATVDIRLDRSNPGPCAGEGVVCSGDASHVLIVASEAREQVSILGLCRWCVATQREAILAELQAGGWNLSAGLVDLDDDVAVRTVEREVADMLDNGWIPGAMPSAS